MNCWKSINKRAARWFACGVLPSLPATRSYSTAKKIPIWQPIIYCAPGTELSRVVHEVKRGDLPALRRVVTAGEAMNPAVAERWEAATGIRIDEAYGQTEVLMVALNYPGEPVRYGSMGLPSPGTEMDVIDAGGRRLPPGQEGDLAVKLPNPQLMLGYWKDAERTAACFVDGPEGRWYLTSDRAEKDADGYFWYRGRSDDVINSAGYRIGPLEVENALAEHAAPGGISGRPCLRAALSRSTDTYPAR